MIFVKVFYHNLVYTYNSLLNFLDVNKSFFFIIKGCVPLQRAWPYYFSVEDLIFIQQASMGIKSYLQKKNILCKKKTL